MIFFTILKGALPLFPIEDIVFAALTMHILDCVTEVPHSCLSGSEFETHCFLFLVLVQHQHLISHLESRSTSLMRPLSCEFSGNLPSVHSLP